MRTEDQLGEPLNPRIFHVPRGDAIAIRRDPTGAVGTLFSGAGMEMVWVAKREEAIDPAWFSQATVDVLLVVRGQLRVEFEQPELEPMTLDPGDVLVLPPQTRCRAYRWPRERQEATIFLAVYPTDRSGSGAVEHLEA